MIMSVHEDDELLARLASGEVTEQEEPARSALVRDPALRARWEGLRALDQRMEELRRERRRVIDRADRMAAAPGDARIRERLLQEVGVARRPRPRWWMSIGLAAAAAVLVGFFVVRALVGPEEVRHQDMLLGGEIELVAPVGPLARGEAIAWRADLPAGGRFELLIEGRGLDNTPFEEKMSTYTNTWTPTDEIFERSTGPIQVTVSVLDVGGLVSSRRFEVSLSR